MSKLSNKVFTSSIKTDLYLLAWMYSTAGISLDCLSELAQDRSPCSPIVESKLLRIKLSKKAPASALRMISKAPKG